MHVEDKRARDMLMGMQGISSNLSSRAWRNDYNFGRTRKKFGVPLSISTCNRLLTT